MESKKRIAIITTHPIQYNAPLFQLLRTREVIDIKVFYTWGDEVMKSKFDPGFNREISWDIPLLNGYPYEFVKNTAKNKGTHSFLGINNPDLVNRIQLFSPHAILVYGWNFLSHIKVLFFFHKRVPILFRGDSTLLDQNPGIKTSLRFFFLKFLYKNVDVALYTGRNNFKYFKKYGLKEIQLVYAPHAVDNDRFSCEEEACRQQAKEMKKAISIPDDGFILLFAGKLEQKKDPELLIKAFLQASGTHQKAYLLILGNGELERSLKSTYQDCEKIKFMDFQNQSVMPAIYRMVDVFVLPSRGPNETWGLAINEAMAAGKTVIVSDKCGGAIDLIINERNGFIFKAGDLTDLTLKIKRILDSNYNLNEIQIEAKNHISKFSLTKLAEVIEFTVTSVATT